MNKRAALTLKFVGVSLVLIGLVWIVFGQTLGHRFVNFDDGAYVYRNSEVLHGFNASGIKWAFTHAVAANWHPLTILSHMLDCQLYGVTPAGHHFTNVLLHSVAAVLLFFLLLWMTGALWRSAFVAAIFAVHPLHVESVAWIAERKDVLSAIFFMLALAGYVFYARRPSFLRYLIVLIFSACGLMAKPMLVTLPFLLLLLDYWPLGRFDWLDDSAGSRFEKRSWKQLLLEKLPLLALSAAASAATIVTQEQSINLIHEMSLPARIGNAFVSLVIYLRQSFWPHDLAVFYPYPDNGFPVWEIVGAIAFIAAVSVAAFFWRSSKPYFFTGWFWFVGMMVPVIGIVQVGIQAHADRYNYLPQIGLGLIVAWATADFFGSQRYQQVVLTALSLVTIGALAWTARFQTSLWYDSQSLWEHALAVAPDNSLAREHLSDAYLEKGRIDDSVSQAREAVKLQPNSADSNGVLGAALARTAHLDEALTYLRNAERLNPKVARVHYNIGNVLLQQGEIDDAIANYEAELRIQPGFAEGQNNLASALFRKGQPEAALSHLKIALQLNPNYPEALNNFGIALSQSGQMREASAQWEKTLSIQPDNLDANCNLAWIFATFPDSSIRDGSKALRLAERALQLSDGKNAKIWRLVAAAHGELGQFAEAIKAAQNGLALAESENNAALTETLKMNIARFESGLPLRDVSAR